MDIRQLPSGAFQARVKVDGVRRAATFDTRREAEEWETVTRAQAITGTEVPPVARTPVRLGHWS